MAKQRVHEIAKALGLESERVLSALKKAGVPAEMHLYAQGGHAFGLRRTKLPITEWPQLAEKWLGTLGMISQ